MTNNKITEAIQNSQPSDWVKFSALTKSDLPSEDIIVAVKSDTIQSVFMVDDSDDIIDHTQSVFFGVGTSAFQIYDVDSIYIYLPPPMTTITIYPKSHHLLTQIPTTVPVTIPDNFALDGTCLTLSDEALRKSIQCTKVALDLENKEALLSLSVPDISANSVPYTINISPDTPILTATKE